MRTKLTKAYLSLEPLEQNLLLLLLRFDRVELPMTYRQRDSRG